MQKDLSQGKVFATMSLFALPMLLGNVLQQAYNVVDTWVVGRFVGAGVCSLPSQPKWPRIPQVAGK